MTFVIFRTQIPTKKVARWLYRDNGRSQPTDMMGVFFLCFAFASSLTRRLRPMLDVTGGELIRMPH
jgi:hypothetical protein